MIHLFRGTCGTSSNSYADLERFAPLARALHYSLSRAAADVLDLEEVSCRIR